MPATVTLSLEEYDTIRKNLAEAHTEIAQLKKQLVETKMNAGGGEVGKLVDLGRAGMRVAGFAMSQCSPEVIKGWPFVDLARIGALVEALPDVGPHDVEFGREMVKFAHEAEIWEARRKQAVERYIPPPAQPPVANAAKLAEMASQEALAKNEHDVG